MVNSDKTFSRKDFLEQAVTLAEENVRAGGRPFGALVVKEGEVVATGVNRMHLGSDPTAHAELLAVRAASQQIGSLAGTSVYASGRPCPMCMAAMRLAGVSHVFYAYSNADGAPYGLSTEAIRQELAGPEAGWAMEVTHTPCPGHNLYALWQEVQQQ